MDFLDAKFLSNTVKDWLIALGVIILCYVGAKILLWFTNKVLKKFTEKTKSKLDDLLVDMLEEPIAFAIGLAGVLWTVHFLNIPNPGVALFLHKFLIFIFVLDITWLVSRTVDAMLEVYVVPLTDKSESEFDDQLLPIVQKGLRAGIWIMGIILALDNLDVDIGAMIAGLGIGGLALALAAQDAIKNIFGGIMIFLDKPFKIKDRIQIHGFDGTVEEVGLRSTRVRTLAGRIVTMPNSLFSDNEVINVSSEPSRKVALNLGLTYDTTPENMALAMQVLKDISAKFSDRILPDTPLGFNAFGDFSMGILFIYYIKPGLDNLAIQSEMNLEILTRFNENGLEFAFPTQTIYKKEM